MEKLVKGEGGKMWKDREGSVEDAGEEARRGGDG